jgi:hypothetical protein
MITIEKTNLDERYSRILANWNNKIHKFEQCCQNSDQSINKPSRILLQNKIENLKSYFYSARYYAASIEDDSRKILRELVSEMKNLESEISSILTNQTDTPSRTT